MLCGVVGCVVLVKGKDGGGDLVCGSLCCVG